MTRLTSRSAVTQPVHKNLIPVFSQSIPFLKAEHLLILQIRTHPNDLVRLICLLNRSSVQADRNPNLVGSRTSVNESTTRFPRVRMLSLSRRAVPTRVTPPPANDPTYVCNEKAVSWGEAYSDLLWCCRGDNFCNMVDDSKSATCREGGACNGFQTVPCNTRLADISRYWKTRDAQQYRLLNMSTVPCNNGKGDVFLCCPWRFDACEEDMCKTKEDGSSKGKGSFVSRASLSRTSHTTLTSTIPIKALSTTHPTPHCA